MELYKKLEYIVSNWNGKVCVFGAGRLGTSKVYELLRLSGIEITCFIDNNVKPGTMVGGCIPVESPEYLKDNSDDIYVIACFGMITGNTIEKQLIDLNVDNYCFISWDDISFFFDELEKAPSYIKNRYSSLYDDELFLTKQYFEKTGMELNLTSPRSYNEKLQWMKINYRDPATIDYVDKYKVKSIIASKIGIEHIIPTINVWEKVEDICFDDLPERFVLKCTHDSGRVAICKDKSCFNVELVKTEFERALKHNYFWRKREWQYKFVHPRIIAEEFIGDGIEDIMDYKFFCFDGVPRIIQVDYDRFNNHRRNLYTTDWEYIDASIEYPTDKSYVIKRPDKLDEMLGIAGILSEGFIHVRVDLYNYNNKVYFGEMTFCHGAGYERFSSDELANTMGKYIKLPIDDRI